MKKKLKKALIILGSIILILILVLITAVLLFFYQKPLIKGLLEKQLIKRTGIQVTIGALDYELFPLRIEADSIKFIINTGESQVDVSMEKLILRGDIHRILKKQTPYFDSAEGFSARIRAAVQKARKKVAIEDLMKDFTSSLTYVRRISLKNSFLHIAFANRKIILQNMDFALAPSTGNESLDYELISSNTEFFIPTSKIGFRTMVRGTGTLSLGESPRVKGRFFFKDNLLAYPGKEASFEEVDLFFSGEFRGEENSLVFPDLDIDVPSSVHLACPLTVTLQDDTAFYYYPRIQIDDLKYVFSFIKEYIPSPFDGVEMQGSASFEGEGCILPKQAEERVSISGTVHIHPTRVRYKTSRFSLGSTLSGSVKVKNFPKNRDLTGKLTSYDGSYSNGHLQLSGFSLKLPIDFSSKTHTFDLSPLNARFKALTFCFKDSPIEINEGVFQGSGLLDLQKNRFTLMRARIQFPSFPTFHISARADLDAQGSKSLSLQASDISLPTLLAFLSPLIPRKVEDWEPEGRLNFQIEARNSFPKKDEVWDVEARLETFGIRFHDPSFSIAGESLRPKLTFKGVLSHPLTNIPFSAAFELTHGDSLWRDYYIDWNKMPLRGKISGRLQIPERKLMELSAEASIPSFGKLTAKGCLETEESHGMDFSITASELQLASLYSFYRHRDTNEQAPVDITGEARGSIDVKTSENDFSVSGSLKISNASITTKDRNFSIKQIEAALPLNFRRDRNLKETGAVLPEIGFLSLEDIHTPFLDVFSLRLDVSSHQNRYTIEPFEMEIFGKKASIGKTSIDLSPEEVSIESRTSLFWKDVELTELPFESNQFQLKGRFSVNLPEISILANRITTAGQSEMEVFGGEISILNLQIEKPFSKNRAFSFDARFRDINLEKVTDLIPFGRVTGIIDGEIDDLIFAHGQPEHFNLALESKKRKGVPQKISLTAANDLAVLGTGEKTSFSPNSGWTRIINSFNYKKIGISCALKNDIFTLRGTIHEGGFEYLVKGSWLFGINVVNKHPQNKIRFKDLMNRLKRIGQSRQPQ